MATTANDLGKTIELLWDITFLGAEKTFEKIKSTASIYIMALIKCTALCIAVFFVSIILKATTGWLWFAYIGVFPAIFLTMALIVLGAPLGILFGMIKEKTANPAVASDGYFKFVTAVFFIELLAFIYVIEFPVNLETVLKMTVLGMALAVCIYRFGTIFPPKLYNLIIMGAMAYTTLSLFYPNPINYVSSFIGCSQPTYSTYQGRTYGPEEVIIVTNKPGEFSDVVTLNGRYKPKIVGWAHFLPKDSDKYIVIKSSETGYNYPSLNAFKVRSQFGIIKFEPTW